MAGVPLASKSEYALRRQRERESRQGWSVEAVERELQWRRWFPQVDVDWKADELPEAEARLLFDGAVSFIESNLSIRVPGRGQQPLVLRQAQKDVLWSWIRYRNNICLKARQIGFSTLVSAYVLWQVFGWSDRPIILLSKGEREAKDLLIKAKYNLKSMPGWVRERGPRLLDKNMSVMTFDNDSVIESLPSANDPARGKSAFQVVVDEWAFLNNPESAWASIEPISDIGGRLIGISTANGEGNFFHELWVKAERGENGFRSVFFPWSAVDDRDQAWYEQKCQSLLPWQRAQEYPGSAEEAFVGSGNPVFDLEVIRRFREEAAQEVTITASSRSQVLLTEGGPFSVWEPPNHKDRWTYVVGADIAMDPNGDYTVAWVLCVNTGEPVAVWYGRCEPDVFGFEVLPAIGWYYRNAYVCPEINNHGLTTLKALQRSGYRNIYRRRSLTTRRDQTMDTLGWLTTKTTKPLLVDELGAWLREVGNVPHRTTLAELRQFVRDQDGKMHGSPHDDTVIALGLAVQARKWAVTERGAGSVPAHKVQGSFAWWDRKLDRDVSRSKRGVSPVL
jgi:hypothetical protein